VKSRFVGGRLLVGLRNIACVLLLILARYAGAATDADGDGFDRRGDCNDSDARIHPGATEICNGLDDDCDPTTSESGMISAQGVAYATIQDAVDAAPDGATVRICEGTYFENIVVDSDVILEGAGAHRTILDGGEDGSVVRVDGRRVQLALRGLTLQHGTGTTIDAWYCTNHPCGGAIEAYVANSLAVEDCVIRENTAYSGGGIFGPESGSTTISGSVIRDNECTDGAGGGAALFEDGTGTLAISDSEIRDNTCALGSGGGGLALASGDYNKSGAASIVDSVIDGNVAGGSGDLSVWGGGGIHTELIDLTLEATTISNNTAVWQGGGIDFWGTVVADDDTVITRNVAEAGGGVSGGSTWSGGRIERNDAVYSGGGVYAAESTVEFRDVAIAGNHSGDWAGGILIPNGATLLDSSVTDNTVDGVGGGLFVWRNPGSATVPATVDNCVVTGNRADHGGGAYVETRFESVSTDWGRGGLDNAPDDVYFDSSDDVDPAVYTDFARGADFECTLRDGVCE
jgi:hypothetical protein